MRNAPEIDTAQLEKIYATLHLAFHRNKNQHGKCAWWKWLAILRRTVLKLLNAAERQEQPQRRDSIADVVRNLAAYLNDHVIPRCYLAFSTVVADNQFAALGTVLIATLAQLQRLIAPILLRSVPTERRADDVMRLKEPAARKVEEDLGEVVCRDTVFPKEEGKKETKATTSEKVPPLTISKEDESASTSAKEEAPPRKKSKTKKKAKKNAIDELFDALG